MTQVTIETEDGKKYSVDVQKPDPVEKMQIAAKAPDELVELGEEMEEGEDIDESDAELTPDIVDYMVEVATNTTELEENHLRQLSTKYQILLCSEILNVVFDEYADERDEEKRVKRVRLTQEFVTHLFRGEMAMVAGLPDNATFEDFNYDPARMELQFIFSSDEWEPIPEGAQIPVVSATGVEIPSSTKKI